MFSTCKNETCEVVDVLINSKEGIISQCVYQIIMCILEISYNFFNYTSIKLGGKLFITFLFLTEYKGNHIACLTIYITNTYSMFHSLNIIVDRLTHVVVYCYSSLIFIIVGYAIVMTSL